MKPLITLAVPHHNRPAMLAELLCDRVLQDRRISKFLVVDDFSSESMIAQLGAWVRAKLQQFPGLNLTVALGAQNVDCYANKERAVRCAKTEWVVLMDDDNQLAPGYLDALFALPKWEDGVAYLPTFAMPHFDYRVFDGLRVDRHNVAGYCEDGTFLTALNTANHFFQRDRYLAAWDSTVDPHTADSIYMNYRWLLQGGSLQFVAGMHYHHRVHDGSHYKQNVHRTAGFDKVVERMLRSLR